jgi:hypothetical protein
MLRDRLRSSSSLLFLLSVAACGGTIAIDGSPGQQSDQPDPKPVVTPTTTGTAIEGSFDLQFTSAKATLNQGGPTAPPTTSPSLATGARLDIRKSGGGYEAVFTARWGTPAAYAVEVSGQSLTLTGSGAISGGPSSGISGASDTWERLVLPRDAAGGLTGEVRGTGREIVGQGDVIWEGTLTGSGTVKPDVTPPSLRGDYASRIGPSDKLLPWDPILVRAAEPVEPNGVEQGIEVQGDRGETLVIRWDAHQPSRASWAGETSFTGYLDDWARAGSGEPWTLFASDGAARDLAGNYGSSSIKNLSFLRLGGATTEIGFDTDVIDVSTWGDHAIYGGGLTGQNDPRCESGGCMRIGPVRYDVCGVPRAGFAGLLQRVGAGYVELRYRVLAKPMYDGPTPMLYGDAVTMQLATQGAAPRDASVPASTLGVTRLASPVDDMSYGTDWVTLEAAAPQGTGPIGVAVVVGGAGVIRGGCGGPPPPPASVEILVERVRSK